MALIINNLQNKVTLSQELLFLLEQLNGKVLQAEKISPEVEVSLSFVDDSYIKELNKKYRDREEPTDVLSFPQEEDPASLPPGEEILLGDIIISLDRATEQAREEGHSLSREISFLFLHGLLHLLGYDHQEPQDYNNMWSKKEGLLKDIDFTCYP